MPEAENTSGVSQGQAAAAVVDADGFTIIGGYGVKNGDLLNERRTKIVRVSATKFLRVNEDLTAGEQFDLFEIMPNSMNRIYLNMATTAARVIAIAESLSRIHGAPMFRPFKTLVELKKRIEKIGNDGLTAVLAVEVPDEPEEVEIGPNGEMGVWTPEVDQIDAAKN